MPAPLGVAFHGEFSSADASAIATEVLSRILLYGQGSVTALTLNANDQVIVTDMHISLGAQIACSLFDGADNTIDAGELLIKVDSPVHVTTISNPTIPRYCQKGTYPKVKTSAAGQVDVTIQGTIIRLGS